MTLSVCVPYLNNKFIKFDDHQILCMVASTDLWKTAPKSPFPSTVYPKIPLPLSSLNSVHSQLKIFSVELAFPLLYQYVFFCFSLRKFGVGLTWNTSLAPTVQQD